MTTRTHITLQSLEENMYAPLTSHVENAYKQLSSTPENKKLGNRPKPCYQIFAWKGWYFARKHNVPRSLEIKTQLIYYTPTPKQHRWEK
jgi:hypothetical protein